MKPINTNPESYPRRILVAVTGLSPQIVTETLYVLAVQQAPAFMPTEVRLITTEEGAQRAQLSLLHEQTGWFHRLCADYGLPPIAFGPEQIHVLKDANSNPLSDIRSVEDNTAAADAITDLIRELTGDDGSALHVSIAGGRKTMGFYLGYVLSLFGRIQDRLSHVLVSAPYESNREFFYPTPENKMIPDPKNPNGQCVDARDAKVTLAEIPFVRMREGLDPKLMEGEISYSVAVADAQRAQPPKALQLDPTSCHVTAGGERFHMPANKFAFYWLLAERAANGRGGVHWSEKGFEREFLQYYGQVVGTMSSHYEQAEEAYGKGFKGEDLNPIKAHVKKELEQHLGRKRAKPYLIDKLEKIPNTRYWRIGLSLPPEAISLPSATLRTHHARANADTVGAS